MNSMLRTVILILVILLCWDLFRLGRTCRRLGYYPSGGLGLVLLILVVLLLAGEAITKNRLGFDWFDESRRDS